MQMNKNKAKLWKHSVDKMYCLQNLIIEKPTRGIGSAINFILLIYNTFAIEPNSHAI